MGKPAENHWDNDLPSAEKRDPEVQAKLDAMVERIVNATLAVDGAETCIKIRTGKRPQLISHEIADQMDKKRHAVTQAKHPVSKSTMRDLETGTNWIVNKCKQIINAAPLAEDERVELLSQIT